MTTYQQTTRNQFDTPAAVAGERPNVPADFQKLAQELDDRLGVGGAETAATVTAITAIPSARCFEGKMAVAADTGWRYRYTSAAWVLWSTPDVAFTPVWASGITAGNGTQYARWKVTEGRLVDVFAQFVFGSTSAVTGGIAMTLPNSFTLNNINGAYRLQVGDAVFYDTSAGNEYYGTCTIGASTTVVARLFQVTGTLLNVRDAASTVPMTWAVGDQLSMNYRVLLA